MTLHSSGEALEDVLAQLRSEEPLEPEPARAATLRHEAAWLEEQKGDVAAAQREYLAAVDGDADFREPLEALVRILGRRGDPAIGRLWETLVDLGHDPAATSRALWELAIFRLGEDGDADGARALLEQGVEQNPGDATAWLELELLAAADGDHETQARALEARAQWVEDPTWQGVLLVVLAQHVAATGDTGRATTLLDTVVGLEGRARYLSRLALERVARQADDPELQAHALEGQAELIAAALEDPTAADRSGVPRTMCTPTRAAEAWMRAGELRRRSGDAWGAVAALTAAAERLDDNAVVARLSLAAADAAGDGEAATRIARDQLASGVKGPAAAAMWVRLGRAAERSGAFDEAVDAFGRALVEDPGSILALTLRTDLLAGGDDPGELARSLEAEAEAMTAPAARARGWLSAAYVWSVRAGDVALGSAALEKAVAAGVDVTTTLELSRSFALLAENDAWYEQATAALWSRVEAPAAKAALAWELGRLRWRRGDDEGATQAFSALAEDEEPGSRWLGRALLAYAVRRGTEPRGSQLLGLAEVDEDPFFVRGLTLMAALLAYREGDVDQALQLLGTEHERDPGDIMAAAFFSDLARQAGRTREAANALRTAAASSLDAGVGGALNVEAGVLLWRADERAAAIEAFETAMEQIPEAARHLLPWALRASDPNDVDARGRAVDTALEADGDEVAATWERFGLGLAARDGGFDPLGALDRLDELSPGTALTTASMLGRLLLGAEGEDGMERLAGRGGIAPALARAEQFRLARFVERDASASVVAGRQWHGAAPHMASALEWLAAAFAADDADAEVAAREALSALLDGQTAVAAATSASVVRMLRHPERNQPLFDSDHQEARWLNLELARPGGDPQRRARALHEIGETLGDESGRDARRLAAWNELVAGASGRAQATFKSLAEADPEDIASWEGLRVASEAVGDQTTRGVALARLGNLTRDDARAAALWEEAGLVLLEHTEAHADAEIALQRALDRDPTRFAAFDKLFRRVRKRKENKRLLKLIELRLGVTDDDREITKMYWERARVYREEGDSERALASLHDVTMLEPDHVGALALSGEISIKAGDFKGAAPLLARLATLDEAPRKQRLLSGIAAVDLYEKRLDAPKQALGVLLQLYRDGLSTQKVRERLARTAARLGDWEEATKVLERLMGERDSSEGRAEAARLAMAIYRDKLERPDRAVTAVEKLLDEVPDHPEAIELLLKADVSSEVAAKRIPQALDLILGRLARTPCDPAGVALVIDMADHLERLDLLRAALGVALALTGTEDAQRRQRAATLDARGRLEPRVRLDDATARAIADPGDTGVIAEVFVLAAPVVAEALTLTLKAEEVGRRQRVDSGTLRTELSHWTGALNLGDFELYVGGRDPAGVRGIPGDKPAFVIGEDISAPFAPEVRSAIAREAFALARGTSVLLHNDDATVASAFVAVCRDAGVELSRPSYAVFGEVERQVKKAMSRRIRKLVAPVARQASDGLDATAWAAAARRSIDRMALIGSGDASHVIDRIVGPAGSPARAAMKDDPRATQLLAFALSDEYLRLRAQLGMGIA
ncbi:MAG: hypothetical protein AAF715_07195 [Myxococcota bacterium]